MLKMAGVQVHPAMRIVIGAAAIAVAMVRHHAAPLLVVGGAFVLYGVVGLVDQAGRRRA